MLDLDKWENRDCLKCHAKDVRCCYGICDQCRPGYGRQAWEKYVINYKSKRNQSLANRDRTSQNGDSLWQA
jgi:hypothetical protein